MKHKNSALKSLKKEKTKERKRGRDKEVLQKRKYKHGSGQKKKGGGGKFNKMNKKGNKDLKQLRTKNESVVPMRFLISQYSKKKVNCQSREFSKIKD